MLEKRKEEEKEEEEQKTGQCLNRVHSAQAECDPKVR